MLQLRTFVPSADKVRQVEFHPVQPWVVSSTKSNQVVVWDWTTGQVLHDITFGGADDETSQEQEISRLHLRDPVFAPNPSSIPPTISKSHSGHVKDVHFLDLDVAQRIKELSMWPSLVGFSPAPTCGQAHLTSQHNLVNGTGTPPPQAEQLTGLRGQRLLVVACEHKVILYDLLARKSTEIGKTPLDAKAPTCVAFLYMAGYAFVPSVKGSWVMNSPLIAVGCNDGMVRIIHIGSLRQVAKLVDGHKTPVVQLSSTLTRGRPYEQLVAGHQSGNIALWEPLAKKVTAGDIAAKMDSKSHDKPVVGIVQAALTEDPEVLTRLIFTAGQDNRINGFEPSGTSIKETSRIKLDPKTIATSMAYSPRGFTANGTHTLLVGTDVGLLLSCHPSNGSVRTIANLSGMVPCGAKKQPKIYSVSVHPVMPQYVVLGTNVGTLLMALESLPPISVAPLPLRDAAQAHTQPPGGTAGTTGEVTYMSVVGDSVFCNTVATLPSSDATHSMALTEVKGKLKMASGQPSGRALVTISGDGAYVAVTWPASHQYCIYHQGAAAWDEIARGCGTAVAWHATDPKLAILEGSQPSKVPAPGKPGKKVKGKEAEAAAAARAAAEKAAAASSLSVSVQIREMSARGMAQHQEVLHLGGDTPVFVVSGPLLGVTFKRQQVAGGDLVSGDEEPNVMQLYDWETASKVGSEMPEPLIVAWDPSLQLLALAYSSQVVLLRAQPTLSTIATLAVGNANCIEWGMRQLFISTSTHVHCAFVSSQTPKDATTASTVHVVDIAACNGAVTPTAATLAASAASLLPPPATRPPGPLLMLGSREGHLWFVNAHAQPLALPLLHVGLRCMCLAASGDLQGSLALAVQHLFPGLHDQLASFYVDMDGIRGAGAALGLPGLTLAVETRLRLKLRQWPQALEACEALLAGFHQRPQPGKFVAAAASTAFAAPVGSGMGVSAALRVPNPVQDLSLHLSQGTPGLHAPASGVRDEVDWMQPLRQSGGTSGALHTAATEALRPPVKHASREAIQLTLELLTSATAVGLLDLGKHIAKLLLTYASDLDSKQTAELASCMAYCGMNQELPQLVHRMVPGADALGQEAAGLLAALLSGHTSLAQDVLKQNGAAALAAAQAQAYRLGASAAADQEAWKQQLRGEAGAAGLAAHHQSFAFLSIK